MLHASFFIDAQSSVTSSHKSPQTFKVAVLDRPDLDEEEFSKPCGILREDGSVETIAGNVQYVNTEGARKFLRTHQASNTFRRGLIVLVTVKQYQIVQSLSALVEDIRKFASCVILLHNGIRDEKTECWIDEHFLAEQVLNAVTSAGATLLTKKEILLLDVSIQHMLHLIVRPTGSGSMIIFPRCDNAIPIKINRALSTVASSATSMDFVAIPNSRIVSYDVGTVEQILKLCVNISLNGILAMMCLEQWYEEFTSTHDPNHILKSKSKNLVRRVINKEMNERIDLACDIARVVLNRAYLAMQHLQALKKATKTDEAAIRTRKALERVPENCCSTVVDICSGRRTEGSALLSVLRQWPQYGDQSSPAQIQTAIRTIARIDTILQAWDSQFTHRYV